MSSCTGRCGTSGRPLESMRHSSSYSWFSGSAMRVNRICFRRSATSGAGHSDMPRQSPPGRGGSARFLQATSQSRRKKLLPPSTRASRAARSCCSLRRFSTIPAEKIWKTGGWKRKWLLQASRARPQAATLSASPACPASSANHWAEASGTSPWLISHSSSTGRAAASSSRRARCCSSRRADSSLPGTEPSAGPAQGSRRDVVRRVSRRLGSKRRSLPPDSSVTSAIWTALPSRYSTMQPAEGYCTQTDIKAPSTGGWLR